MTHKAFDVIGERVLIKDLRGIEKEGIFQESTHYRTTAEEEPRPALDFIVPMYDASREVEILARGMDQRERVHPENPILSLHMGLDQLCLEYVGQVNGVHVFEGELKYVCGAFLNDGNFEIFDRYKGALRNADFDVV